MYLYASFEIGCISLSNDCLEEAKNGISAISICISANFSCFPQFRMHCSEKCVLDQAETWSMERRLHGQDADYPNIAAFVYNLGLVSEEQGKQDEAEKKLNIRIYGQTADRSSISTCFNQLGRIYEKRGGCWMSPRSATVRALKWIWEYIVKTRLTPLLLVLYMHWEKFAGKEGLSMKQRSYIGNILKCQQDISAEHRPLLLDGRRTPWAGTKFTDRCVLRFTSLEDK